jgi:hypothetical protein
MRAPTPPTMSHTILGLPASDQSNSLTIAGEFTDVSKTKSGFYREPRREFLQVPRGEMQPE